MSPTRRSFAIIPACGESRRMGTDKLLLPWQSSTILETVIDAWRRSKVDHIFVVIPQERTDLQRVLQGLPVRIVLADPRPSDMKGSIQLALKAIEEQCAPSPADAWLVAPADMPTLSSKTIDAVLEAAQEHSGSIVVPVNSEKRGHPVLLPWHVANSVQSLPSDQGINALLNRSPLIFVNGEQLGSDVDTPADYRKLRDRKH